MIGAHSLFSESIRRFLERRYPSTSLVPLIRAHPTAFHDVRGHDSALFIMRRHYYNSRIFLALWSRLPFVPFHIRHSRHQHGITLKGLFEGSLSLILVLSRCSIIKVTKVVVSSIWSIYRLLTSGSSVNEFLLNTRTV